MSELRHCRKQIWLLLRLVLRLWSGPGLVQKDVAYTLHEMDVAEPSYLIRSRFFTMGDYILGRVISGPVLRDISCRLAGVLRALGMDMTKSAKAQARANSDEMRLDWPDRSDD